MRGATFLCLSALHQLAPHRSTQDNQARLVLTSASTPNLNMDAAMPTRVLVPTGALGITFDRAALARGVAAKPDIIAVDGGSTDSGPYSLGSGTSKYYAPPPSPNGAT